MSKSDVNAQFAATIPSILEVKEVFLSNRKLYLTPTPVDNNLAFFDNRIFAKATIGAYLRWWTEYADVSTETDENGVRWYIYRFAGSPLSGNNECCWVSEAGETRYSRVGYFLPVWSSFVECIRSSVSNC